MLLSIVECDCYKNSKNWETQIVPVRRSHSNIEWVGPVKGPTAAHMRNRGALRATGHWLFFKDSDCDVNLELIVEICKLLEQSEQDLHVVGGIYKNKSGGFLTRVYSFIQRTWVYNGVQSTRVNRWPLAEKLLGGALLVKRSAFLEVGGFSERVGWGGEELEFLNRARQQGMVTAISFRLIVEHSQALSFMGLLKRAWYQNFNPHFYDFRTENQGQFVSRYFQGPIRYWPVLTLFFGVGSVAGTVGVVAREWKRAWK